MISRTCGSSCSSAQRLAPTSAGQQGPSRHDAQSSVSLRCSCVRFPRTGHRLTPWFRVFQIQAVRDTSLSGLTQSLATTVTQWISKGFLSSWAYSCRGVTNRCSHRCDMQAAWFLKRFHASAFHAIHHGASMWCHFTCFHGLDMSVVSSSTVEIVSHVLLLC